MMDANEDRNYFIINQNYSYLSTLRENDDDVKESGRRCHFFKTRVCFDFRNKTTAVEVYLKMK